MDLPESSRHSPTSRAALLEFLVNRPCLFNLSADDIALREMHARLTRARSAFMLLRTPRHRIERELEEALRRG